MKLKYSITFVMAAIVSFTSNSKADIDGFNMLLDWTLVQQDGGVPIGIGSDSIDITSGASQTRNVWHNKRLDIREFTASFTYRTIGTNSSNFSNSDVIFIVQNDSSGTSAEGGTGFEDISPSIGVRIRVRGDDTRIGFFRNGSTGSGDEVLELISAIDQEIDVEITVSGNSITVTVSDGINEPFFQGFSLDPSLEESFGSINGFVGFGGATSAGGTRQRISNFQFDSVFDVMLGDLNQDGCVDLLDVAPFVELITSGVFQIEADINNDGAINLLDVAPFVNLLTG